MHLHPTSAFHPSPPPDNSSLILPTSDSLTLEAYG